MCEDFDTSVNLAWTSGTNCTRFGIAAKYQLDPTASISVSTSSPQNGVLVVGITLGILDGVESLPGSHTGHVDTCTGVRIGMLLFL